MPAQPDVLQSCLQEAARAARPALERCIDQAIAVLQAAEAHSMKMAERDELARAWRDLARQKPIWSVQYPADLLVVFKANVLAAAQTARQPEAGSSTSGGLPSSRRGSLESTSQFSSIDSFSLVDDADVSQAIEAARLLQQMLPPVEQVLAELNSLVSTLQGLPNVRPDLNPLRPEAFAQALRSMVNASAAEPEMASLWLRHISATLGGELKKLYEQLVRQLEQSNIQGASYRVLQTPASASRPRPAGVRPGSQPGAHPGAHPDGQGGAHGPGPGGADGAWSGEGGRSDSQQGALQPSEYADLSNYEIKDELFQDFLFYDGGHAQHRLAPSYYEAVDQELAGLQAGGDSSFASLPGGGPSHADYQDVAAVDRPQRNVGERSQLDERLWGQYSRPRQRALVRTQLKKKAERVGQVLGLEVVRKLVNQVAQDHRLLVPVREAIVALEPALLRLAMQDPRFFSDEHHPGRRLMERTAQRSFKYNDEFSLDFLGFFKPVGEAFNALNHQDIDDAQPFAEALAELQSQWDAQDQLEASHRQDVLSALRFAEERQSLADQIAFDLSARSDLEKVPALVLDFLFGPWSLAMAHARLVDTNNRVDPMGFGSVVPDLLWSVKREVTLKRPAKLIEMIPSLLGKLHAGLELLGQDPRENEAFFEALMRLHRPVLRLRRIKSRQDAEESGAMPLEQELAGELDTESAPATPEQRRARAADHPWLGRDDLDAAGFEDTLPSAPGELVDAACDEGFEGDSPDAARPGDAQDTDAGQFDWEAENQAESEARTTSAQSLEELDALETPAARSPRRAGQPFTRRAASAQPAPRPEGESAGTSPGDIDAGIDAGIATASADGDVRAADAPPSAAAPPAISPTEAAQVMASLRTGHWVDLYSRHHWLRAQLVWASSKGTLFMFVSHGGQPHSMTKRSCERLIAGRLLRPVDSHGVVEHALDAVAAQASQAVAQHGPAADDVHALQAGHGGYGGHGHHDALAGEQQAA